MPPSLSRVHQLRVRAGLSIIELAVYAGVSRNTVQRIEAAERAGDVNALHRTYVDTFRRLARALDVPLAKVWPALARES